MLVTLFCYLSCTPLPSPQLSSPCICPPASSSTWPTSSVTIFCYTPCPCTAVVLALHLSACLFFYMAYLDDLAPNTWVGVAGIEDTGLGTKYL